MDIRTVRASKEICPECKGNGYIKTLFEEGREELISDCKHCDNQGEITKQIEEVIA
jgi:DnaJ-class molecular chaperone|tara:strand:+ start:141 stop:308 length:168 start_codon:yes stop_codon:yes gene_type:complete